MLNLQLGCAKKIKTENQTKKPNQRKFQNESVQLTEPEKKFGFWFDYGSDSLKIQLTCG